VAVTRRRFIGLSGAAIAAFAARPVLSFAGVPLFASPGPVAIPDLAAFTGQLGSSFRVKVDGGHSVDLKLAEASAAVPTSKDASGLTGDAYSLIFKGPRDRPFPAATYAVTHGALGSFSVFIVPVDRVGVNRFYQVVVDQRRIAL
jgi:uncharacterized protein DUF6916